MTHWWNRILDWRLLRRVMGLLRPYRQRFYQTVAVSVVLAVLAPLNPLIIQWTVDHYILANRIDQVWQMALLLLSSLTVQAWLSYWLTYHTYWLGQSVIADLRRRVFRHILHLHIRFFDRTPVGTAVTRTIHDVEAIDDVFSEGIVTIISDLLMLTAILTVMFISSWQLTLVTLSVLPFLLVAVWIFKEGIRKSFTDVRNQVARLNAFLQEHITGMSIVKIFQAEQQEMEKFKAINRAYRAANIRSVWHYSIFLPLVEIIAAAALGLLVWFGAYEMLQGRTSPGMIISFILYINLLFRPIRMLADKFNTLQMGLVAADRIFPLLDLRDVATDTGTLSAQSVNGHIAFQDVSFAYKPGQPVLRGVSFEVAAGQSLAIVGPTGAGKTTLVHLLMRFHEPQEGQVLLDGIPITKYSLASLRRILFPVLQDVFLFSDTLLENIRLYDKTIDLAYVEHMARRCGLHDWIAQLPGGYFYPVSERGASLSAGQRQLISFLRALVFNPRILVLDEATSAVDTASELLIQQATALLMQGRTSLVIAHRLSTIRQAHRILVLDHGQVAEYGTHDELLKSNGMYRRYYELQIRQPVAPVS